MYLTFYEENQCGNVGYKYMIIKKSILNFYLYFWASVKIYISCVKLEKKNNREPAGFKEQIDLLFWQWKKEKKMVYSIPNVWFSSSMGAALLHKQDY